MSDSPSKSSDDNQILDPTLLMALLGLYSGNRTQEIDVDGMAVTRFNLQPNVQVPEVEQRAAGLADAAQNLGNNNREEGMMESSNEESESQAPQIEVQQPVHNPPAPANQPADSLKSRVERVFRNEADSDSEEEAKMSRWFREYNFKEFNAERDIKMLTKLLPKKNTLCKKLEEETIKLICKVYQTDQLVRTDSLAFVKLIFEELFDQQDILDWLSEQYQNHQTSFGFCQKATKTPKNFMYQCFDCFEGGEDTKKFLCAECFARGNHRGHKTTRSFLGSICDCGSMNPVNNKCGNCPDHNGQFPIDTVLNKSKLLILEEKLKTFIALVFKIVEMSASFAAMKVLGEVLGNLFFRPLNKLLYTFPSMIPHISMMFVTPLHQIDGVPRKLNVEMQHDHKDLNSGFPPLSKPNRCDCSAFELIFRYSLKFTLRDQKRFNQLAHRLISYRPFLVELGGQWLKMYNKVARTKGESEEKKPPLANIKHDIVVDAEIMVDSVKKYGLTHFIAQIFKNMGDVLDNPEACFVPGLNVKLPSSINVLPSITKYPENCQAVMSDPAFLKSLYPSFMKMYAKVLGQGLRLRKQNEFMHSEELQVFLMRYQYDIYHSINQLIFGLKNNDLRQASSPFLLNVRFVVALMLQNYHKRLAEPVALKTFEGFGPRTFLTYMIAWLCLDCSEKEAPRICDIKMPAQIEFNQSIFSGEVSTQTFFYQRLCRSFADMIGSMFFIRRLKWDIWDQAWQKLLQVYEKIEFDGIDICGLQFSFCHVKFGDAVAELFRGFFTLEAYQSEKKTKPIEVDWEEGDLQESINFVFEDTKQRMADYSVKAAPKKAAKSQTRKRPITVVLEEPVKWIDLIMEHKASYGLFTVQNYGLAAHTNKVPLLLVDFFNLLTTVCSSEHSIFGVISEMVLVRNSAFRRALLKQEDKFFFPAAKMQFLHLMLALKTVPCDEFFDLMKAYVCCEEGFQESVIAEYCDVDFENQVIKLKPKAEEIAMKNFDSSCFSLKRASEDFDNRWEQNIKKEYYDKLSFKKSYTSELIRQVREKLSECDPGFIVEMVSQTAKLVGAEAFGKKPFSLEVSMMRFVLLYLHTLQDQNFGMSARNIKTKSDVLIPQVLAIFEEFAKESPVLKLFKAKLDEYRVNVLSETVLKRMDSTDKVAVQEESKCAARFKQKMEGIFAKMKRRQNQFFSMLDDMTASFIKDFNTVASADTMVCSVSREQLSDKQTFFIFANVSESNLLHHSKINLLKKLAEDKSIEQGDLQIVLELIEEEKRVPKEKLDSILITQCGHFLKSEAHAMIGDPKHGYRDNEYICPVCKSSSNCLLPIYTSELWEGLNNKELFEVGSSRSKRQKPVISVDRPSDNILDRMQNYYEWYTPLQQLTVDEIRNATVKQEAFRGLVSQQNEIAQDFVERIKTNLLVNIENLIKNGGFSIGCISSLEDTFFSICPASFALASLLRYSELKGFATSIGVYGQVMHSLYLTARVQRVQRGSFSPEAMGFLQQQLKTLTSAIDFKTPISVLLCLPALIGESEAEVETILRLITGICLDLLLVYLIPAEVKGTGSSAETWGSIRYSRTYSYVVTCITRFLRTVVLLFYGIKYPHYQKNKKLLEKLIQMHLKSEERELDYLLAFLDLPAPGLTGADARVREALRTFGVEFSGFPTFASSLLDEKSKQSDPTVILLKKRRVINSLPISLALVQLGNTMKHALEIFYHTACKHCNNKAHMASMCLICGEVICGLVCGFSGNILELKKNGVKGQLCKHSITEHKGKAAYLNCESLFVLLFDDSRKIVFKGMYFNKFGKIGEKDSDFEFQRDSENFFLNSKRLDEIYQLIANNEGLQYIMRKSFTEDLDPVAFFY